jgi:ABC-type uncharacterized transport system substrate-binding protein
MVGVVAVVVAQMVLAQLHPHFFLETDTKLVTVVPVFQLQ